MAAVYTYSLKKDGEKKLSANFKVKEFRCKDGSDTILICPDTVKILQAVRDYFGKPVTINSAYRTASYNKRVGGVTNSQHVKGTACDIKVADVPSWAVAAFLEANYKKNGIGYYPTFVHVDSRGYRVLWQNTGNNVKSTFGIGTSYARYKAKPVESKTLETPVLKQEDEELTQKQFDKMYNAMVASLAEKDPANWADLDKAITWAQENGIIKGDKTGKLMMQKPLTRQEMVLMMYRYATNK